MTRANLMKQLQNMNFDIGIYLPGIHIKTSPTDWSPIEQLQMMRFKGESWELFGPMMDGGTGPS
jgi:branched-chain amino acid transport system substrate-binding protein